MGWNHQPVEAPATWKCFPQKRRSPPFFSSSPSCWLCVQIFFYPKGVDVEFLLEILLFFGCWIRCTVVISHQGKQLATLGNNVMTASAEDCSVRAAGVAVVVDVDAFDPWKKRKDLRKMVSNMEHKLKAWGVQRGWSGQCCFFCTQAINSSRGNGNSQTFFCSSYL